MDAIFSKNALKQLKKNPDRKRIVDKLKFYLAQKDSLQFAESLRDHRFGQYRFRIGNYRVFFDVKDDTMFVLKVGHRRDVYQ